jgi:outer membrane protein, heavy metal efflux system
LPPARRAARQAFDGARHRLRQETDVTRSIQAFLTTGVAALLVAVLAAPDLAAQVTVAPDTVRRISLGEAILRLESHNLELRLARDEAVVAEARVAAAGVLPNPALSAIREQLSGEPGVYHETILQVGQTLPIGGQRGLRREAARRTAEAARARLEGTRLRLAFEVHRAYLRAAAAEADLVALGETTDVFRRVEESGRSRLAEGDISRFDQSRLQIERARYETLLARARLALAEASRELTLLVAPDSVAGRTLILPSERLGELAAVAGISEVETALLAAAGRTEVRAAEAGVEAAEAALTLQRRLRVPDVTLSGGYKHQADGYRGAVLGVSVPLPLWDRNRGGIAEAEANLAAARTRRELALRSAESEIRRAWETRRSLEERMRLIGETLLPESAGLLETARLAYAEGEMTLVELLDAADAYRGARESVTALAAEFLSAAYELERATGRLLAIPTAPAGAVR